MGRKELVSGARRTRVKKMSFYILGAEVGRGWQWCSPAGQQRPRGRKINTLRWKKWGCAKKFNTAIMQRYQSKLLRTIANVPWYVNNHTLHTDIRIPYVRTVIHDRINKHRTLLATHPYRLMQPMLQPAHNRRLKRRWTFDQKDWGGVAGWLPRSPMTMPAH